MPGGTPVLSDPNEPELPQRYEPVRRLGRGGGGEVWAVRDRATGRTYALKLLAEEAEEREMAALVREAVALSGLEGLGVPRVIRFGRLPGSGRPYLVREVVEGESLEALLSHRGSVQTALETLARAADQLTVLHRAGLLHGDVKPANIIVEPGGSVVFVDLGLAAPWREGGAIAEGLTPRYAAPELFEGKPITVRAEEEANMVVLRVRDTGIGIAPEVLPRIFDLFVQERQAIDRAHGGLGLGLTIVRNLVERHGGSVSAHSDGRGHGSEFVVRLPRVEAASFRGAGLLLPAAAEITHAPAGARRILVVDDNEDSAEMLAEALKARGYQTRVSFDAPAALLLAPDFCPDLAFLDIGLPVMDGYELARRLREVPGLERIRLVALTGYGQESDRRRTRAAGFQHHLVKPVDLQMVEAVVTSEEPV